MNFKVSYDGRIKRPKITLHTPNLNGIGMLRTSDKLDFELNANNICSLEFNIYKTLDGKANPYYDLIDEGNLIQAESLGVYWIIDVEINGDGINEYKEVKCKSLEYELTRRKIFDINGVYYLYSITNPEKSLLHEITNQLGNWSIGHVDNALIGLARTFKIDSADAYSLLTDDISKSFGAIFQFDTYNRKISAYTIENFGKRVNIVLDYRNLVKENIVSTSLDKVVTCLRVRGGGDLDIRAVNPTLSDKIYNYGFFMVKRSEGGKVSDELVDAWNAYQTKYNNLSSIQQNNLIQLQYLQEQLLNLQNKSPSTDTNDWTQYGLVELKSKKSSYDVVLSALLSNGAGDPSSSQYAEYKQNKDIASAIEAEIKVRENQIRNVQSQIDSLNNSIINIANDLSYANNFTQDQIKELMNITFEDEYVDDTYVIADTDTEVVKIEKKKQLYEEADKELMRLSQPQYTIDTKLSNLYMLPEFKNYQGDFWLGNIITIRVNKDYIATARLLSIKIDFEKLEDISVVFANRNRLDDSTIDFQKIQEQAKKASTSISIGGQKWDEAARYSYEFSKSMTESLNLATRELWNADNQEVTIGAYGIRGRERNPLTGDYDPEQFWMIKNKIVFSDDGFNTAKTALGKYTYNGVTYYGLIAEAIVGTLFIGEKLRLIGSGAELDLSANETILGLSASITANINGLRSEFNQTLNSYSTKSDLNSAISQSASQIMTTVSATYSTKTYVDSLVTRVTSAESSISQLANEISLKVSSTDYNGNKIVSMINQSSSKISMSALNIDLSGYVTFTSLSTPGSTEIDGSNLKTGTVIADSVKSSWVYTGSIDASQIKTGIIIADQVKSSWVYTGNINANQIKTGILDASKVTIANLDLSDNDAITGLTAKINADINNLSIQFGKTLENYSTTTQMNSAISASANSILSTVNSTLYNYSTTTQMNSAINQSASSILSTVSSTYATKTQLTSVEQTANKISWLVKSGTSSTDFTLTDRVATLIANAINITGYVKFTNLSTAGQTTINGGNITTGTIDASKATITNINATNITTGTLNCSKITVSNFSANNIVTGTLDCSKITVSNLSANSITTGSLSIERLIAGGYKVMSYSSNELFVGSDTSSFVTKVTIPASYFKVTSSDTQILSRSVKIGDAYANIGFFGSYGTTRRSVSKLSSSAGTSSIIEKINELLTALNSYNLIYSY